MRCATIVSTNLDRRAKEVRDGKSARNARRSADNTHRSDYCNRCSATGKNHCCSDGYDTHNRANESKPRIAVGHSRAATASWRTASGRRRDGRRRRRKALQAERAAFSLNLKSRVTLA